MALRQRRSNAARVTGHVSHEAQVRIDKRVARILARRGSGRLGARTAAPRPTASGDAETRREP